PTSWFRARCARVSMRKTAYHIVFTNLVPTQLRNLIAPNGAMSEKPTVSTAKPVWSLASARLLDHARYQQAKRQEFWPKFPRKKEAGRQDFTRLRKTRESFHGTSRAQSVAGYGDFACDFSNYPLESRCYLISICLAELNSDGVENVMDRLMNT